MKRFFCMLTVCLWCIFSNIKVDAQTACLTVNGGYSGTISAPTGNVFTSVEFASYGTPTGSCGSFVIDNSCHSANSQSVVEGLLLGQNSLTISPDNPTFGGDPCFGVGKHLSIQATYSPVNVCITIVNGFSGTITAPMGKVFTSVVFASYGRPTGTCSNYMIDNSCHATNSKMVVEGLILGQNSVTIEPINSMFGGDPCFGFGKHLTIEAAYGTTLPIELYKYSVAVGKTQNQVYWETASESQAAHFEIERSADGLRFQTIGTIKAANQAAKYHFTDENPLLTIGFYRLKMVETTGKIAYSKIVSTDNSGLNKNIKLYPNPAQNQLTVEASDNIGWVAITDVLGRVVLTKENVGKQTTLDINTLQSGLYFMKSKGNVLKFLKK